MSDWTFKDLEKWDNKISKIAKDYGLDWYPINYEICDYYEMIGHMSYHGMPSHYQHWSYGKSFERTHQMYNLGAEGLPYELIINSNPSIAYLMKENPIYLQVLIMCHCVGHSDFFKNNRNFSESGPESIVMRFRNAKKRIQEYSENPHIGLKRVELFLDSLHAIRFHTERNNLKRLSKNETRSKYVNLINNSSTPDLYNHIDVDKRLISPDSDLLSFLIENGSHFEEWQIDILEIVKNESQYFIPQIKTKILNEGWASFWHYKLMHELDLPQKFHIPFLKSHNQVLRPNIGKVNPYHLGFYIFKKIEEKYGLEECFFIREIHDDSAAIRIYLQEEDFHELNLFTYSSKPEGAVTIDEISDSDGWKLVKNDLIKSIGMNSIPEVVVSDISDNGDLIIEHTYDGRDLDLLSSGKIKDDLEELWGHKISIITKLEGDTWEI